MLSLREKVSMMRVSFRKVAVTVLGLYFMVTCYTGYMLIKKKFDKTELIVRKPQSLKVVADEEWNPWGQEFEHEGDKPPLFERPHLILEQHQDNRANSSNATNHHHDNKGPVGRRVEVHEDHSGDHVVEIWGKAAIGLYLWEHILGGELVPQPGGMSKVGMLRTDNILFRFRTGPGVVPGKVPHDTEHLVLVLNGREKVKVDFATTWIEYIRAHPRLKNVAVMLLGNEQCNNKWLHRYLVKYGGPVKFVFVVYDSPEVDDQNFYQWPLGVATYRGFPRIEQSDVAASSQRQYLCNFLGTVYPNTSRQTLLHTLQTTPIHTHCLIHARQKWLPQETTDTRERYVQALTQSDLTLNPTGTNTECYRIYEAMSLGSVPVVENVMTSGRCANAEPSPLRLLKQHGAPLILVTNWTNIGAILEREHKRPLGEVIARRKRTLQWYADFKRKMKNKFIRVLKEKFFSQIR